MKVDPTLLLWPRIFGRINRDTAKYAWPFGDHINEVPLYFKIKIRICSSVTFDEKYSIEQRTFLLFLRDLDATVMRAIASLLSGLPLQPEVMETDIVEAKSQLFLKWVQTICDMTRVKEKDLCFRRCFDLKRHPTC